VIFWLWDKKKVLFNIPSWNFSCKG